MSPQAEPTVAESDWAITDASLKAHPTRWGSLSWVSARALIDAVNQALDFGSNDLVTQLRGYWLDDAGQPVPEPIRLPEVDHFVIIGDTGEQDASQYVVSPELSRAVRVHRPGFVLIMSDVIYPAGDVNDYLDGVYRPYKTAGDQNFRIEAPLLALPGNHDWYDGLAGFMYHFCGRNRPSAEAYAPGDGWRAWLYGRLFRILWRRAAKPRADTAGARAAHAPTTAVPPGTGSIVQRTPYYVIETAHLDLVCIDTGIDGSIDEAQWRWLQTVSAGERSKILVTGKPLVVNAKIVPCRVGGRADAPSVWDLVNDPANRYVATVGGDTHNYQKYVPRPGKDPADGPQLHLVSGSGGAFMHATHTYANAQHESRLRNNPKDDYFGVPVESFPSRNDSFRLFAGQLVPSVVRMLRDLALFLLGVLVTTGVAALTRPDGPAVAVIGWAAAVLAVALVVYRVATRGATRSTRLARWSFALGCLLAGLLGSALACRLDPDRFLLYVGCWLGLTAYHCLLSELVRVAGWWKPADEFVRVRGTEARVQRVAVFYAGLAALAGLGFLILNRLDPAHGWRLPLAVAVGLVVVAVVGWIARRPRFTRHPDHDLDDRTKSRYGRANRLWYRWGTVLAALSQAGILSAALWEVARRAEQTWLFHGAWLGVAVGLVVLVLSAVALVLLTEASALVGWLFDGHRYRLAWGTVAKYTHHGMVPIFLIILLTWMFTRADGPAERAAAGLPLVLVILIGLLLSTERLRQRAPKAYLPIVLAAVALGCAAAYAWPGWPVRVALGALLVLIALVFSVLLGHLTFLGALRLLITPGAGRPSFSDAELDEIFAAHTETPPRPPKVPAATELWSRLTYPGLGEPGGPLQKKISEVYARDKPPFYKGFLRLETTPTEVTIVQHQVFGVRPSQVLPVGTLRLDRLATPDA